MSIGSASGDSGSGVGDRSLRGGVSGTGMLCAMFSAGVLGMALMMPGVAGAAAAVGVCGLSALNPSGGTLGRRRCSSLNLCRWL